MTPDALALAIVRHFHPPGRCLEPCAGEGAFVRALEMVDGYYRVIDSFEIDKGKDFLAPFLLATRFDWTVTNPPWSKIGSKKATKNKPEKVGFLKKAMQVSDNIVFLCYANAWFVKSRINAMKAAGFHFREFAYVANPKKPWPQMGLQLAAVHISRTPGNCIFTNIDWTP